MFLRQHGHWGLELTLYCIDKSRKRSRLKAGMQLSKEPLFSIIVPTFNLEPYITDCLESIESQTISKESFELIIVDDGSTDNTKELLNEYILDDKIGNFILGDKSPCMIVAELSGNHNGNFHRIKQMIIAAKKAGADAVKFQTWYPGELTGRFAKKIDYLKKNTNIKQSRYYISQKLCLSYKSFFTLKKYAKKIGIDFLSTPDGEKSLDFVSYKLNVPYIKIGSTELNNLRLLYKVGKKHITSLLV